MKLALLQIILMMFSPLLIAEEVKRSNDEKIAPDKLTQEEHVSDFLTLKDPRPSIIFPGAISLTFDNGVAPKNYSIFPQAILVIHWQPPSDPKSPQLAESKFGDTSDVWQISGLTGYFTQSEVESILKKFYSLYTRDEKLLAPDLIVAGNNWGSGRQIEPVIGELSKNHKFRSYHIAGAFTKATLNAEPEERIKLLKEALSKIQQGEDGTDKTTSAPKSKPD